MLPGVWICDEATRVLRRQIARRTQLVRGRTRARNQIHATLIRNLGGRGPAREILSKKGRQWLAGLELPADERATVLSCLREADFLTRELKQVVQHTVRDREDRARRECLGDGPGLAWLHEARPAVSTTPSAARTPRDAHARDACARWPRALVLRWSQLTRRVRRQARQMRW